MKIVQIIPSLRKGGAERVTVDLCNYLVESGHEVTLISLYDNIGNESFLEELYDNVRYISLNKKKGFDFSVLVEVNKLIKKLDPDVVHTHINSFEYVLFQRLKSKKIRFVHTIHSKAEKECPNPVTKQIRKYFFRKNTIPVTISKDGDLTYKAYYSLNNSMLIENGRPLIQPSPLYPEVLQLRKKYPHNFIITHIGRIIKVKNQELLIRAMQLFNEKHIKRIQLLMIGGVRDESLFNNLQTLVNSKNKEDVIFLGDQSNVGDYLMISDAFCLSSSHEGMPISLIEAFAVNCPPVSTPVGGIPEMIDAGQNGFLSEDMSVAAYLSALEECLFNEDIEMIKKNCKETFKSKYDISISANKYVALYNSKM